MAEEKESKYVDKNEFNKKIMQLSRSNMKFRKAVSDLLYEIFDELNNVNFNKQRFLQQFKQRESTSSESPLDFIRKMLRPNIVNILKTVNNTANESVEETEDLILEALKDRMSKEDKKKSDMIKFELRTAGEFEDGGYEEHYKVNTVNDPEISNRAEDLIDIEGGDHFEPFHKCPKCSSSNLYKTALKEYVECEDCDYLFNIERNRS